MAESRAEIKIRKILEQTDLHFEQEYSFPGLNSPNGRPLRFDFAVFDDDGNIDFLIEYQGKQHYEPVGKYGGVKALYQQQFNDNQKRNYCRKFGYNLIEIPYQDENLISYDYIMEKSGY